MLISVLSAAVGVFGAGCGGAESGNGQTQTAAPSLAATHSTGSLGSSPSAGRTNRLDSSTSETPSSATKQEGLMKIRITIGEQRFQATLSDSDAARDLIAQLPVTIDMVDHGAVEKTGPLPSPLSLDGSITATVEGQRE